MVIIVAATGIASFSIPQYNIAIALKILRFPLMISSALLGGFGMMICFIFILHRTMKRLTTLLFFSAFFMILTGSGAKVSLSRSDWLWEVVLDRGKDGSINMISQVYRPKDMGINYVMNRDWVDYYDLFGSVFAETARQIENFLTVHK